MKEMNNPGYGPITHALERVFNGLRRASLANVLFGTESERRGLIKGPRESGQFDIWRSKWIDCYVICWLGIELTVALLIPSARGISCGLMLLLVAYRVIDILQASINMNVFAHLRRSKGTYNITSATRALVLTLWTYLELALCFGIVYSSPIASLTGSTTWSDPYYFSAVTQLTIGYGDIAPLGLTKLLAPLQGLFGFLLALVAIGRLVSFLPRPDSVVGDIE
jgi:hypothetical protein